MQTYSLKLQWSKASLQINMLTLAESGNIPVHVNIEKGMIR